MKTTTINNIKDIDIDIFAFHICPHKKDQSIYPGIEDEKIYKPVLGIDIKGRIIIYEGTRRARAALKNKQNVGVYIEMMGEDEAFIKKLRINKKDQRKYHPIELSNILKYAKEHNADLHEICRLTGLKSERFPLYEYLQYADDSLINRLIEKIEFLKVIEFLRVLTKRKQKLYLRLMNDYRLNVNQSYECIQSIEDHQRKYKTFKVESLIKKVPDGQKPALWFVNQVRSICMPEYTKLKQKLQSLLQAINDGPYQVKYNDNFEMDHFNIEAKLSKKDEINLFRKWLNEKDKYLKELSDLINND